MTVIQMPKRKTLATPKTSTSIPKDRLTSEGVPTIETTLTEAIAIKKWLLFALTDIHFQLEQISKDTDISRRSFADSKQSALLISSYLIGVLDDLTERIASQPPIGAA